MTLRSMRPKLAIVTGAAGGMGSAVARRFAQDGFDLLLSDLDRNRLEPLAAELRSEGRLDVIAGDVVSEDFPAQLSQAIASRPVDAVVHCAGLSPSMADARRILQVNYDATVRLVETVRAGMAAGGCVVLIASIAAYWPKPAELLAAIAELEPGEGASRLTPFAPTPQEAYHVSKRAVLALAARQAAAFAAHKARIVSISPGLASTDMGRREQAASPNVTGLIERTPLGRFAEPDEIAATAAFLCSAEASYITGCDIRVDGGAVASLGF